MVHGLLLSTYKWKKMLYDGTARLRLRATCASERTRKHAEPKGKKRKGKKETE